MPRFVRAVTRAPRSAGSENRLYVTYAPGVRVDAICYGGMIHGFVPMGRLIESGNRAVAHIAASLRQALQPTA